LSDNTFLLAEQRNALYAMRTFALSDWGWITDAALLLGYELG
jgi:hypothetical protein